LPSLQQFYNTHPVLETRKTKPIIKTIYFFNMKKTFTLFAVAALATSMSFAAERPNNPQNLPDGVVYMSYASLDTVNSTKDLYKFEGTNFTLSMESRAWRFDVPAANGWGDAINVKNNAQAIINIPDGVKVYRIDMIGYSQSTAGNWEYLAAWGTGDKACPEGGHSGSFEYVANTPWATKDNDIIQGLEYPISPAPFLDSTLVGVPAPFAKLDFGTDPYEGEFPVVFTGNNQLDVCYVIYTSRAAADAGYSVTYSAPAGEMSQEEVKQYVAYISYASLDTINSTKDLYKFTDHDWTLTMESRAWRFDVPAANGWGDAINIKNNAQAVINIPEGKQLFRIDMYGYSQSTAGNWEYLAAWGTGDKACPEGGHSGSFEYVANTPWATKDNEVIQSLEYPISPAPFLDSTLVGVPAPFAVIDFGEDPYEGEFPVVFTGNNQLDACFVCYFNREAANTGLVLTYEPKQEEEGISQVSMDQSAVIRRNIMGQTVGNDYRGIVIENGRKMMVK